MSSRSSSSESNVARAARIAALAGAVDLSSRTESAVKLGFRRPM